MDSAGAVAPPEKFALSEFRGMVVGPGRSLHLPGVLRPRDGAALAPGVAGGLPGGGDPEPGRLPGVHDRRPVDPRRPERSTDTITAFFNACAHRGTRLASGHRELRHRRDPLPLPRLAVEPRRGDQRGGRPPRLPAALTDDDVRLGEVQVGRWGGFVFVNMDPNCESFDVVPRRHTRAVRLLPLRGPALPLVPDHRLRLQLEDRRGRLQRGLPPPGTAPPDADLVSTTPASPTPQLGQHSLVRREGVPSRAGPEPPARARVPRTSTRPSCSPTGSTPSRGLFTREDRAAPRGAHRNGPPEGKTAVEVFNEHPGARPCGTGIDLDGLTDNQILRNGTIHLFPNLLGPIVHGNATLYRARPERPRSRQRTARLLGPRVGSPGRRGTAHRAEVLRGLVDQGLGPDQQPGLRQPGRDHRGA